MAILNQKRILNLIPKTSAPVTIHVSQGDVGTEIEFTLVKGDELFVDTGNLSASVHGVREDGANFGVFTCTLSGSSVKFPLHAEMTAVKGSAIAEIVLVDSQGNKVGSSNFGIMVEESVFPLGVTYDNDVSVYESILAYVQTIPAQVTQDYNTKINAETAARQAADSSLNEALANEVTNRTSAVNTEKAAREAADDVLGARIDQIIAPSGEAPSAAEVADARVGDDTVTYDTLGTAIRTQISDLKTNMNDISLVSNNIYNASTDVEGSLSDDDGSETVSTTFKRSTAIYFNHKSITLSRATASDALHGAFKVVVYNSDYSKSRVLQYATGTATSATITPVNDETYIRIVSVINADPYMVNYGDTLLPYVAYGYKEIKEDVALPRVDNTISELEEDVDYVEDVAQQNKDNFDAIATISQNIYDYADDLLNYSIDGTTGEIVATTGYRTSKPIALNEKITFAIITTTDILNGAFKCAVYNEDDTFSRMLYYGTSSLTSTTITPQDSESYIRLVSRNDANPYMANYGEELLTFMPYGYKAIKDDVVLPSKFGNYIFSSLPLDEDFTPITYYSLDGTTGSEPDFNYNTVTAAKIYDKIDAVMADNTSYITKTFLGYDQSGEYPIYKYSLHPDRPAVTDTSETFKSYPKILISSGMHGYGASGDTPVMPYALTCLIYDLCNNWQTNEVLRYLRWKVNFEIIPISNPWGFNNKTRTNSRGVDINRNFDYNWTEGTPGTSTYGGTEPFSEAETQILKEFIEDNSDAAFHIDYHSTGEHAQNQLIYFEASDNSELIYPAFDLITELSDIWNNREYPNMDNIPFHGYIVCHDEASVYNWAWREKHMPSTILEGFADYADSQNPQDLYEEIVGMCYEELGSWIVYLLRYFRDKYCYY